MEINFSLGQIGKATLLHSILQQCTKLMCGPTHVVIAYRMQAHFTDTNRESDFNSFTSVGNLTGQTGKLPQDETGCKLCHFEQ